MAKYLTKINIVSPLRGVLHDEIVDFWAKMVIFMQVCTNLFAPFEWSLSRVMTFNMCIAMYNICENSTGLVIVHYHREIPQ